MEKAVLCLFVGTSNCYVVLLPIYCDFTLAVSGSETLISDGKAAYNLKELLQYEEWVNNF
jgi:hypothetical protein